MYKVTFSRSSYKQIKKLPINDYIRIFNAIAELINDPFKEILDVKKLTDQEGYRVRIGNYRILYTLNLKEKEVYVKSIAHRKDAY